MRRHGPVRIRERAGGLISIEEVALEGGKTLVRDLSLESKFNISGTVTYDDGSAAAGLTVVAMFAADDAGARFETQAVTDADGRYALASPFATASFIEVYADGVERPRPARSVTAPRDDLDFVLKRTAAAPPEPDAKRFLADLEMVQRQITSLEIKGESRRYDADRETGALKESPYNHIFTVSMDRLPRGRVKLDNKSVVPWKRRAGDAERPLAGFAQHAYNGDVRTYIDWSEAGEPTAQEISAGQPPDVGAGSRHWGIDLLASTYGNIGLAQLLRRKEGKWSVEDRGKGLFAVSYRRENYEGDDVRVVLLVDLSRNGIISEILLWSKNPKDGQEYLGTKLKGDFARTEDGIWLPRYAESVSEGLWTWKTTLTATANVSFPDETFVLDFVPGHIVRDNITGTSFIAGAAVAEHGSESTPAVVELDVHDDSYGGACFADLDKGEVMTPRRQRMQDPLGWMRENGIDAVGETSVSVRGLACLDMKVTKRLPAEMWEAPDAEINALLSGVERGRMGAMKGDGDLPATYAFETREGTRGILQILEVSDRDRLIKVRYRVTGKRAGEAPISLVPSRRRPERSLSGRVLDGTGQVVAGAEVSVWPHGGVFTSDDEGRFKAAWMVAPLPEGLPSYVFARQHERGLAGWVTLEEGAARCDVTVTAAADFSGTVTDPDGMPIPGAAINLWLLVPSGEGSWQPGRIGEDETTTD
ncbi:MAG: carboxypeptidase-like regulatory domain-containing protein, partial [Planctomycetota bacterium]